MIVQTGLRTDIPAFYAGWFANRLREGYVMVRNPYHPVQVTRYLLSPQVVDLIAFCTKNPAPMFPYLELLKPYGQYWFVTITPYDASIEPGVPPKDEVLASFRRLSLQVGKDSIGWRYDPIFLTETYSMERHLEEFADMARQLAGYTDVCVISFLELYQKVKRNFPQGREVGRQERLTLGREMVEIGKQYGIRIKACAEGAEPATYGADCSGCLTAETYEKALHKKLRVPRLPSARPSCGCLLGSDIGAYNTCGHLCRYCYANYDEKTVRENRKKHDPASPFLIGRERPEDMIRQAKQESWIDEQMSLW